MSSMKVFMYLPPEFFNLERKVIINYAENHNFFNNILVSEGFHIVDQFGSAYSYCDKCKLTTVVYRGLEYSLVPSTTHNYSYIDADYSIKLEPI